MKLLSIETSCDETAISIIEANGDLKSPRFGTIANALISQINLHKEFGGVFPTLAKREHTKNLPIILEKTLIEASLFLSSNTAHNEGIWEEIKDILKKEEGLYENFKKLLENVKKPDIDLICVTSGPGLEPALWVGISFANALSRLWNIPLIPVNHMEGHIASILFSENMENSLKFPALAILISGGHTEMVRVNCWGKYEIIGQTVDDALGEAFDKTARLLHLPYPGGPEISKLANVSREMKHARSARLPRPMIHSNNYNFSFSGLKTAVLYYIRDHFGGDSNNMSYEQKADLAREFEDSIIDVLISKTKNYIENYETKTLIIAGGVIANEKIREAFLELKQNFNDIEIKFPTKEMSTDNSLMIAYAGYLKFLSFPDLIHRNTKIIAEGNLKLG